ncbi:YwdI family protein [Viridibacillus sp. YIM B01967]|uniref:YwdI family protein n=1 Tax=Viridibacillus soli TaxID=2798301 RepID=A0ABS1H8F9_9BACL|nr:YwdI family protein [Viridibacillus soli]MBK3495699.1 YwdI family protein [Viridibacillus soli]
MISHEMIVAEIDKHMVQAKQAQNEQEIREALSAVRALCDVVLAKSAGFATAPSKSLGKPMNEALQIQSTDSQQPLMLTQMPSSLTTNKLEEEDANGDSIFDF